MIVIKVYILDVFHGNLKPSEISRRHELNVDENYLLTIPEEVILLAKQNKTHGIQVLFEWPLKYIRKYGKDGESFYFEAGSRCESGSGYVFFLSKNTAKIYEKVEAAYRVMANLSKNNQKTPSLPSSKPPKLNNLSPISSLKMSQQPPSPLEKKLSGDFNCKPLKPSRGKGGKIHDTSSPIGLDLEDTGLEPPLSVKNSKLVEEKNNEEELYEELYAEVDEDNTSRFSNINISNNEPTTKSDDENYTEIVYDQMPNPEQEIGAQVQMATALSPKTPPQTKKPPPPKQRAPSTLPYISKSNKDFINTSPSTANDEAYDHLEYNCFNNDPSYALFKPPVPKKGDTSMIGDFTPHRGSLYSEVNPKFKK